LTSLEALEKKLDKNTAAWLTSRQFLRVIEPVDEIVKLVRQHESTMVISVVNPMSLGLLKPPGDYGVDIVVGDAQPLGNRMSFGGPHLGLWPPRWPISARCPAGLSAKPRTPKAGADLS